MTIYSPGPDSSSEGRYGLWVLIWSILLAILIFLAWRVS